MPFALSGGTLETPISDRPEQSFAPEELTDSEMQLARESTLLVGRNGEFFVIQVFVHVPQY